GIEEIIGSARVEAQFLNEYDTWGLTELVEVNVNFAIEFARKYTYSYEGSCTFHTTAFVLGGLTVETS
ncbi:MAG: hypothetical protein B6U76_06540, partial [Desulfurococcales archaeon ex4484_217_2]